MSNIQAQLDFLKQVLGDEFPEPEPEPEPQPRPESKMKAIIDESSVPMKDDPISHDKPDPLAEGSDSDIDVIYRRTQANIRAREEASRKMAKANENSSPYRIQSHLYSFNPNHDRYGELAAVRQAFCPLIAISKYPYKFLPSDISENVADKFFTAGKFWYRSWDVYYVWPQISLSAKPLFLVPVEQVEKLLDDIYFAFDESPQYFLTLGDQAKDFGLIVESPNHPDLRPRYLGHSKTRETFTAMEKSVPTETYRPNNEAKPATSPSPEERLRYEMLMDLIFEICRGRSKPQKRISKKEEQARKKRAWKSELRHAERLLGLRPAPIKLQGRKDDLHDFIEQPHNNATAEPGPDASWADERDYHAAKSSHRELQAVDPTKPAPYDFDTLPVFLSIDVECYERDKSKVTEMGFAMLDTAELCQLPPGKHGVNWQSKIKARHLRIRENAHLRNIDFVSDAADQFLFPKQGSEFISLDEVPEAIKACFKPPFCDINRPWLSDSSDEDQDRVAPVPTIDSERTIVLVGHDIGMDIRYLRQNGFDLDSLSTASTLDTCNLYRAHEHEWDPTSLSGILERFEMVPWHKHNAGNDAVYTMWAMVALVLQHTTERGDPAAEKRYAERQKQREVEKIVQAGIQAHEMGEGWESEA